MPHYALAVTCLGIIAALFIALGVSNRDYAKSVSGNVQSLTKQVNDLIHDVGERLYDLEKCSVRSRRRECQ